MKIEHFCDDQSKRIHFDGKWLLDCDDGLRGIEIVYCPFCGDKLEEPDGTQ